MTGYRVTSLVIEAAADVEQEWRALEARAECSYFQSWGWIGVWLKQIASAYRPLAVRVWFDDRLVGLGIFVHRDVRRRLLVTSSALYLNEYPFDGRNMVIEYNGLLAEPGHRQAVYAGVIDHLFAADPALDEVILGAIDSSVVPVRDIAPRDPRHARVSRRLLEESATWAVDLQSIGSGTDAFLDSLSKNRRAQLRRAFRLYESAGPLRLEQAGDPAMAQEFLSGLKRLHTRRWRRAGRQGAFANPLWEAFHRALIEARFHAGEIQLLRVCSGDAELGYLYNLVWRNHVYVLQTGFAAERGGGLMPGYAVHALAVEHNRRAGMAWYDLMHGDELYKRILCRRHHVLAWVALQRPRIRFRLENQALAVKRRFDAR